MFNLWLYCEAYKMRHPEMRQVLEWQEEYYQRIFERQQNGKSAEKAEDGLE